MSSVDELEHRVAELERLVEAASEAAQPNYLTIDPATLATGADFAGIVQAAGLTLPAGTSSAPLPQSRIRWTRTSDGAVIADVTGWEFGGTDELLLNAYASASTQAGRVELDAHDTTGNTTGLSIQSGLGNPSGGAEITVAAGTDAATTALTLLTDIGASSWLRLRTAQRLQLEFGFASFAYPGGTNQSNALVVSHNIGRDPIAGAGFVLGLPNGVYGAGQAPSLSCSATSTTTATFVQTLPVGVNPAAGTFGNLIWVVAA